MHRVALIPALWIAAATLHAQAKPSAAIPATQSTQSVSDLPSAHMPVATHMTGATRVTWTGSQLTIEAAGEPMPEVLGRVAHATGLKITGGVPDEHLYGKYGPGSVQTVLGQLFDGLAVNMMLVNESPTKPKELILTARTGGPTPPSMRPISDSYEQPQPAAQPIQPIAQQPVQQPSNDGSRATTTQPAFPALSAPPTVNNSFTNVGNATSTSDAPTTTSNSSSEQPQSPNGVKTPEQIFEELRKRAAAAQGR